MPLTWQNNDLLTRPQRVQISTSELLPLAWDMTDLLQLGESITSPVVTVTQVNPKPIIDVPTAVSGAAEVNANIVRQRIDGAPLTRGTLYEIVVTYTAATGKDISVITMLECVA
jgi:hypothetical protein